jgi:small subunit ribosomal protein S17
MANERAPKKTVTGTVVSDKMDKTITVREERMVKHPLYGKYVRRATVYKAHDEGNQAEAGDRVEILFTRPISKSKRWRLLRVLRKARGHVEEDEASATAPSPSEQPAPEPAADVLEVPADEAATSLDSVLGGADSEPQAEKPAEGATS